MEAKRYWFPVRSARYGWGWGLPVAWQGWAVYLIFVVVLTGGSIVLPRYGPLAVVANFFVCVGALLAITFWKGEPQSMRDNASPSYDRPRV